MGFLNIFGRKTTTDVEPAEAKRRQTAGAMLVDVREDQEYREGHAPGAKLIPLGRLSQQLPKLPKDREVLFICRSGNRSGAATRLAHSAGLKNARNVRGGMNAWASAVLPIER